MKLWCSKLTKMIDDLGQEIIEKVKSSADPTTLKFVRNEDILSKIDQNKIGFLTELKEVVWF